MFNINLRIQLLVLFIFSAFLSFGQWSLEKDFGENLDAAAYSSSQQSILFFSGLNYQYYSLTADEKFDITPLSSIAGFPEYWEYVQGATEWGPNQILLFQGTEYVVLDPNAGSITSTGTWTGLPTEWQGQVDGVIRWEADEYVFFLGEEYVSFNSSTQIYDTPDLLVNWEGWPPTWNEGLSAACNIDDGYLYFFRDANFLAYDTEKAQFVQPMAIVGN